MKHRKRIFFLIGLLLVLVIFGSLGYLLLLEVEWIDALYMATITISTVGYGEVAPMTAEAKIFSILLIIMSIGVIGYAGSALMRYFFEGTVKQVWRERKMKEQINKMNDHIIVCGAGETGGQVIHVLQQQNANFVVVEQDVNKVEELKKDRIAVIHADATTDQALDEANIIKASGLVTSLSTDANNLYTVLTAREMNPQLNIIARAITPNSHDKLIRAGANKTVSPNEIGGHRMASMLLKPSVIAFLDTITHSGHIDLNLNEVEIEQGSYLVGKSIEEANIAEETDLILIAIKSKKEDHMIFNPKQNYLLKTDDIMIVLGEQVQLKELMKLAQNI
ncbi:potassium channel family protein [Amphibacillus cookii]|uniref:potassium channel family protein n=1 Tax=Amphibacillus cookii TaxID=767787 RepID=UPI00195A7427|nr:potassium channel protein [Amphibacillus cookii]MBM7542057.1 voltage-gated potassium channel [Amphibacillus cookii]